MVFSVTSCLFILYLPLNSIISACPVPQKVALLFLSNKFIRFLLYDRNWEKQVVLFLQQSFYPPWLMPYLAAFLTIVEALTPNWAAICRVVRNCP